jgi:hypothetical protein
MLVLRILGQSPRACQTTASSHAQGQRLKWRDMHLALAVRKLASFANFQRSYLGKISSMRTVSMTPTPCPPRSASTIGDKFTNLLKPCSAHQWPKKLNPYQILNTGPQACTVVVLFRQPKVARQNLFAFPIIDDLLLLSLVVIS